jgi:hypothetical protein
VSKTQQSMEHQRLPLSWDIGENGGLTVCPDNGPLALTGLFGSVQADGAIASLAGASVDTCQRMDERGHRRIATTFTMTKPALTWVRETEERDSILTIENRIENRGEDDLRIGAFNVLDGQGRQRIDLGTDPEQIRFFGLRSWNMGVERFAEAKSQHVSSNLCHLYDPVSQVTVLCSFLTLDRMLVGHTLDYTREDGVTSYRASCSAGGYRLKPGKTLEGETLQVSYHRDPYGALDDWAERVHARYEPDLDERPLVIWSGGAWLDGFSADEEDWETLALQNGEAIQEKLAGFGFTHIWTSQNNLKDGLPGNWLIDNDEQIPSGLAGFLGRAKGMGIDHKLWFSPFWFFAEAEGILKENRENLLVNESGEPITEPSDWEWDVDTDARGMPRLTKYYLDGTHPKTQAYVRKIFKAYRAMGANAYMLDFLAIKEGARLHDDSLLPVAAARQILEVIRAAAGEDAHLQTAVASTPGFVGLLNSARVGRDFGEGRPLYPPFPLWHNATYVRHDLHFANTHFFVQNAAANWFTHNKIYCNDLNILSIDKPVPLEHARIAVTLFGLAGGSPLTLGDDFRHIDPERLRMVKLCLPRTGGMPVPIDLFENVAPDSYCRMLKLPVATDWDDYTLVAVYNDEGEGYDGRLDFGRLGLDPGETWQVFEFWNEEYVGTFRESCPCAVPSGAIRLYRLSAARPHPWLLSTDMHILQGGVEVGALNWDEATQTLSGEANRPAGEKGNLFLHLPRQYRLINHRGVNLMKEVLDMTAVARAPIHFTDQPVEFEYRFERIDVPHVSHRYWLPYKTVEEWKAYVAENRAPGDTRVVE